MDTQEFFDRISENYDQRYEESSHRFLHHFFSERLNVAASGIDFGRKRILDIGCGTGRLYNLIAKKQSNPDYFGVDISRGMLDQSCIPVERQIIGGVDVVSGRLNENSIDLFFMLGVTTYMSDVEITEWMNLMRRLAVPGAQVILTITNRASLESHIQIAVGYMLRFCAAIGVKNGRFLVASQSFQRNFYRLDEFIELVPTGVKFESVVPLNQTITPFNRFATGPSLAIERFVRIAFANNSRALHALSSDLLLRFRIFP